MGYYPKEIVKAYKELKIKPYPFNHPYRQKMRAYTQLWKGLVHAHFKKGWL